MIMFIKEREGYGIFDTVYQTVAKLRVNASSLAAPYPPSHSLAPGFIPGAIRFDDRNGRVKQSQIVLIHIGRDANYSRSLIAKVQGELDQIGSCFVANIIF